MKWIYGALLALCMACNTGTVEPTPAWYETCNGPDIYSSIPGYYCVKCDMHADGYYYVLIYDYRAGKIQDNPDFGGPDMPRFQEACKELAK